MIVFRAAEDWIGSVSDGVQVVVRNRCWGLTPMLIKAMMTRIESENMMELRGMGVPRFVTCHALVC